MLYDTGLYVIQRTDKNNMKSFYTGQGKWVSKVYNARIYKTIDNALNNLDMYKYLTPKEERDAIYYEIIKLS